MRPIKVIGFFLLLIVQGAFAAPSLNERSAIGINLTGINYWSSQWMLIDVMKQASNGSGTLWRVGNHDSGSLMVLPQEELNLDAQGWPRSLPEPPSDVYHYVETIIFQDNEHYAVGDYVVLYDGEGQLQYIGGEKNEALSSPGREVVSLAANRFLHLRIVNTDPNNTGNYLRNIRVIAPGGICGSSPNAFAENPTDCDTPEDFSTLEQIAENQIFHPLFLQDMEKYRSIRFMQFFSTNVSEQFVWSDRPSYEHASWSQHKGSPYEVAIELANSVQAEPWLNIPARVDDDYIRRYAQLVRTNLDSNLNFHIELGNEVWNNSYPYIFDALYLQEQGRARWPDADISDFEYRLNYFGLRTAQMCSIFKQEFAQEAHRVQCVMGGQGGNHWVSEQSLSCPLFAEEVGGYACARDMSSLAIGPYFGGYFHEDRFLSIMSRWADQGDPGLDFIFEEINNGVLRELTFDPTEPEWMQAPKGGSLAASREDISENQQVAQRYGLELTAYEGGQHLTYAGHLAGDRDRINTQLLLGANRDIRMGEAFYQHFTDWKEENGGLYMVFESTGRWGAWGAFPLKEYQTQPQGETPKLSATLAFIEQNPCWWDNCERNTEVNDSVLISPLPSLPEPSPDPIPSPEPEPSPEPSPEPPAEIQVLSLNVTPVAESWGVRLQWTAAIDVSHYRIFRDSEFIGHTNGDVYEFAADWLALNQEYQFNVVGVNAINQVIAESPIIVSTAGDSEEPSQPADFTVQFNGAYGFNLNWEASTDNSGILLYLIYRNGEPFSSTTATTFSDDWPPTDVVSYQIVAVDVYELRSIASETVVVRLPSEDFRLDAVPLPDTYGVQLSWDFYHPDVAWFKIYRENQFIGHVDRDSDSFSADWLPLRETLRFEVQAVNEAGELLVLSEPVESMAGDSSAPSQPQNFNVMSDGAWGFQLLWDSSTDNTGIAYYKIYRNGEPYTHVATTEFHDEWPPAGEVSYQIIAFDNYHNGSEATPVVVMRP